MHQLFLLRMPCKFCRLLFIPFNFFSFCSSDWIISNDLSLNYWLMLSSAYPVCYWTSLLNSSGQSLYSSSPKFLFSSFLYFLFVELLILFLTVFLIFLNCLSVFSCGSLSILRTIILNSFSGIHVSSFSWGYWKFTVFLQWCHGSLILCDLSSLVCEETVPFRFYGLTLVRKDLYSMLEHVVTLGPHMWGLVMVHVQGLWCLISLGC